MGKSDFWWLNPHQKVKYQHTEFGHHRPIRNDEDPYSVTWNTDFYSIDRLDDWRDKFQNTNVYRALETVSYSPGVGEIIGPFLIDIDNGNEDLEDALNVARTTFSLLYNEFGVKTNSFKIFFTGRKGFNFEIHPQALSIKGSIIDQVRKSAEVLYRITEALKGEHS